MSTVATPISYVDNIGDTAGVAWSALSEDGPMSMAKLVQAVGGPRDIVMQALGWLAREGKICVEEEGRSRIVSLR
jgi:DNA-binding transcriptional ArsR family regulator